MFVKFLKKQQVEAGDRVLIRNYERGELFSASYTPKRLYLNQVKKCFEMLGPTCTFPELPADKKEALDAVGATNAGTQGQGEETRPLGGRGCRGGNTEFRGKSTTLLGQPHVLTPLLVRESIGTRPAVAASRTFERLTRSDVAKFFHQANRSTQIYATQNPPPRSSRGEKKKLTWPRGFEQVGQRSPNKRWPSVFTASSHSPYTNIYDCGRG
ncbi:hypothetical protein GPALN_004518 [Globodera pallida]|nr:hypothetical protein GPALN_004518 [Globodera pallida]